MSQCRRFARIAVLVAAASSAGCSRGGSKITLRYHPPAGATYHYALEQRNGMKFESGPMAQMPEQDLTMRMFFTQSITGPAQGGIGVSVRFDSTSIQSPLMAPGAIGPALDQLRGTTSTFVYDDRMNIVSSDFAALPGGGSPISQQLSHNIKGMAFPLPDKPVGVGDSWTAESDLPLSQLGGAASPITAKTLITVKQITASGPDTTVLLGMQTTFPGAPIEVKQQGQTLILKLAGTLTGEQEFSVTRGASVHSSMGGTLSVNVSGGPAGAEGMGMSMQQSTTVQLSESK